MLIETLKSLFQRDLNRLRDEISLYKQEGNIWLIEPNIANSAGNLCLHLIGNLHTYIGAEIGKTGYIRDRAAEFSLKDIPRIRLIDQINDTIDVVTRSLDLLSEENLQEIYPILVFEEKTTTQYLLVHLTTHLTYHLGQINYHRRLLDQPDA
ncbi:MULTISPECIES: DinB family protein [Sphingobacterium]|jgi:uncharacterized damage-inducible protein DinB|uniref:DinB family protein n=1 Tax=Sphingobacterium TaxID=28453 RepID=UPI002579B746|nr:MULTISPECIES: DinB family protein [Sphingobacterium]MDF2851193.1 DinB superfamily protein [Sphingobacterium multivorum]